MLTADDHRERLARAEASAYGELVRLGVLRDFPEEPDQRVPALPEHELLEAACHAGHDAYEDSSRQQGHVSGSPVPWSEVPEPYRSATQAGYAAALRVFEAGSGR